MLIEPASQGCEPFLIQHDRFRNTLKSSDLDEFSKLMEDQQKIEYVYKRLYGPEAKTSNDDNVTDGDSCKSGDATLEMKKSGTEYFKKSDYRNALNWYSLAVLRCPQTKGTGEIDDPIKIILGSREQWNG